jgi:hypothetical protein
MTAHLGLGVIEMLFISTTSYSTSTATSLNVAVDADLCIIFRKGLHACLHDPRLDTVHCIIFAKVCITELA